MQDSLPAAGPALPGGIGYPQGSCERFHGCNDSPFPSFLRDVSSSLLLPLHQVGKLDSWEDFQDRQAMTLFTTRSTAGTTEPMSSAPTANGICSLAISPAPRHGILSRQFGVSSSLLLPLHQVGKLDSWEDFQDRQAMTLFTTRSTAGTTEPMSSAPRENGICSLAISPAPRHGILSRSSATA